MGDMRDNLSSFLSTLMQTASALLQFSLLSTTKNSSQEKPSPAHSPHLLSLIIKGADGLRHPTHVNNGMGAASVDCQRHTSTGPLPGLHESRFLHPPRIHDSTVSFAKDAKSAEPEAHAMGRKNSAAPPRFCRPGRRDYDQAVQNGHATICFIRL